MHFARRLKFEGTQEGFVALHSISKDCRPKVASLYVLYGYNRELPHRTWYIPYYDRVAAQMAFEIALLEETLLWEKASNWLWEASGGGYAQYKPKLWVEVEIPEGLELQNLSRSSWFKLRVIQIRHNRDRKTRQLDTELSRGNTSVRHLTDEIDVLSEQIRRVGHGAHR